MLVKLRQSSIEKLITFIISVKYCRLLTMFWELGKVGTYFNLHFCYKNKSVIIGKDIIMLMCIFHDNANQNIKKLQTFLQKVSFFFCTQCHTCCTGTVGPRTMLPLAHRRCSVVQISAFQGSVFQHCASYFTSINPMFQNCANYFISGNPRFQCCASFFYQH